MGGFANGLMLLFGLAAAIPVLIHLWNRRRFREINWAAMEYLLAAMRKHARRIRIEQLILLCVRVLILLTLAVALADPFVNAGIRIAGGARSGSTHWVFVVDGSYSMAYRDRDATHFEMAKKQIGRLLDKSTRGDGFTLILMADPPRTIIREPASSRADVEEELESILLPHGGGDLAATLAEVESVIANARENVKRLTTTKVCFLTDLGQTTWGGVDEPEARRRIARIAKSGALFVVDCGPMSGVNLAVTNLVQNESLATAGREIVFTAEVRNASSQDQADVRVEFFVDSRKIDEDLLDIPAANNVSTSFVHRFSSPGDHVVEARIAGDVLDVDNHRWLSVPVRSSIDVLCVEGIPGSARHVAVALEPTTSAYQRIKPTVIAEAALDDHDFESYQCIIFCNVSRIRQNLARRMKSYVGSGGGLILMLGDQVDSQSYNAQFGSADAELRLLPAQLGSPAALGRYVFDPLGYQHPIVEPFRDYVDAGLLESPVWKYVKLTPYDDPAVKKVLAFQNGDPAIVERPSGEGNVIVYAGAVSPLSVDRTAQPPPPWTAIQTWPSFLPLIHEMVARALRGQSNRQNLTVGESLEGSIANSVSQASLSVQLPSGEVQPMQLSVRGNDSHWLFGRTEQSGIFQLQFGPPLTRTERYAANVDISESYLERIDRELLPAQFADDLEAGTRDGDPEVAASQTRVFQFALAALLFLLVLESLLAWYFGRARGRSSGRAVPT